MRTRAAALLAFSLVLLLQAVVGEEAVGRLPWRIEPGFPASPAQSTVLVVLNKSDQQAALVDPETYRVLAKLPTGKGPHEAAASPDGRYAYISNYGIFGVSHSGEQPRPEQGNTITVLDLARRAVKSTFNLGSFSRPHGLWVSRDGTRVWVTCEGALAVLELDAATGKILKAWRTNQLTSHMVVPTPDERKLYVANVGSGTVSVIERTSGRVTTISTAVGSEGIDVSPDGNEVWVANRTAHTLSVISTASDRVAASFPSGGRTPIRVKFTPDGKQVWVSNAGTNTVTVFDAAARQLIATVEVGEAPVGMVITPDGRRAFVANTAANRVTVLDVASRKILHTFSTGKEPDGMAWAASP